MITSLNSNYTLNNIIIAHNFYQQYKDQYERNDNISYHGIVKRQEQSTQTETDKTVIKLLQGRDGRDGHDGVQGIRGDVGEPGEMGDQGKVGQSENLQED